jgi:phosphate transport system substrate-binding protein
MLRSFRLAPLALLILVPLLAACSRSRPEAQAEGSTNSIALTGAGATFPSVLYNRWLVVYHDHNPKVAITYAAVGSGEGVRRFIGEKITDGEKVDFGASDAAMSDEEIANADNNVLMVPVTAGCVAVAYNLTGFQGDLKLSRRAYAGIFNGEIKKWNDPLIVQTNPGAKLPDMAISPVVRQDASGTTFAFTKNLDAISERWHQQFSAAMLVKWPGNPIRAKGNQGVAGAIAGSDGRIGYVGYEFARKIGLDTAALENKEGKFLKPRPESCRAALAAAEVPENFRVFVPDPTGKESYPIVTFSWILLRKKYKDAATAKALQELFQWSLRDGQRYASELGYIQLPPAIAEKAEVALKSIGTEG